LYLGEIFENRVSTSLLSLTIKKLAGVKGCLKEG
jgi:hypothetical protein